MAEPHLTAAEFRAAVERRLGRTVSADSVRRAIRRGNIRAVRQGERGRWYVPASELDHYLVSNQERTDP